MSTILLIGTRKGVFRATATGTRRAWRLDGPALAGFEIYHIATSAGDPGRLFAAVNHPVWGGHVYRSDDGGAEWDALPAGPAFPSGSGRRLEAVWHLAPGGSDGGRLYAGVQPAALFASDDRGGSWHWVRALEEHPTRATWHRAKGGLAVHSVQADPRDPERVYLAVSAGGCYRTDDGGESWSPINRGYAPSTSPTRRPRRATTPTRCACTRRDPIGCTVRTTPASTGATTGERVGRRSPRGSRATSAT